MSDYLHSSQERDGLESFFQEEIDDAVESREGGERALDASIQVAQELVNKITPNAHPRYVETCQLMLEKTRDARELHDMVSDNYEADVYDQLAHVQGCEGCNICHIWVVDQRDAEEDDEEQPEGNEPGESDEMDRGDAEEDAEEQPEVNEEMAEYLQQLMQEITGPQLQAAAAAVAAQQDPEEQSGEDEDEEEMSDED